MKNLNNLTKKELIQMIHTLSNREVVKVVEVIDPVKKPRIIRRKHVGKCNCCPNPDDHYKIVTSTIIHEMGQ